MFTWVPEQCRWAFLYVATGASAGGADMEVSPEAVERFLSLISSPGPLGSLLRRLHELRVLEKLIPSMTHARGLMQFNEYHKYTVDEHSIRAVEFATELVKDNTELGAAYRSIKDKRLLHLALLLDGILIAPRGMVAFSTATTEAKRTQTNAKTPARWRPKWNPASTTGR